MWPSVLCVHSCAAGVCIHVFTSENLRSLYSYTCLHLSLSMYRAICKPKTAHYPAFIAPRGGPIPFEKVISGAEKDISDCVTNSLLIDRKTSSHTKAVQRAVMRSSKLKWCLKLTSQINWEMCCSGNTPHILYYILCKLKSKSDFFYECTHV